LGTVFLTSLLAEEVYRKWISLSWALEGVVVLAAGFVLKNKIYRLCALGVFSLACLRLALIDMAEVNTIYKITAFFAVK
jgi:uncharacterized membrane protein